MPEKYVRRAGLPILMRHTGCTTLPGTPPALSLGPVVVCLHDAGLQSSVFEKLLCAIEVEGGTAIAFDLPGHGRSGSLDSLASIEAMAEMTDWVSDWCGIDQTLVLGHGMGALIAIEWARQQPSKVEKMILCGLEAVDGIGNDAIETMRKVTRGKAPRPFDPTRVSKASGQDGLRAAYMEGIKTDPRATLVDLEACRAFCQTRPSGWLAEIEGRVCVAKGEAEQAAANSQITKLLGDLDNTVTQQISNAAHFLPLEQPEALARLVVGWAKGPLDTTATVATGGAS